MPENKHLRFFVILLYCVLGALLLWLGLRFALPALAPFIIAYLLARLIERPVWFFSEKLRIPRAVSSILWTIIAFGGVGSGLYFLISKLVREISDFLKSLPDAATMLTQATDFLSRISVNFLDSIPDDIRDWFARSFQNFVNEGLTVPRSLISSIGSVGASAAVSVPAVLLFIIVVLAATYYLSSDLPNLRRKFWRSLPAKWRDALNKMRRESFKTLASYIRALVILCALTFVELVIGFAILKIDYALVLAFFISLIDALPIFGVGTILIPWAIFKLITGDFFVAAGLAILYALIVIVRNLIEPKIVGKQIGLHPLITLAAVYIGLRFFGFWGLFAPIFVVLAKQVYVCLVKPDSDEKNA